MKSNPKNILVVQIGKLGDMVLTNPLFYELKRIFPDAALKVLASKTNYEFATHLTSVDEVILYQKSLIKDILLARKLKKNNFDLWIDVKDGYSRTQTSLLKIAKPKISMGYNVSEKVFDIDLREYAKGKQGRDLSLAAAYYFEKELHFTKPVLSDFLNPAENTEDGDVLINVSAGNPSRYLAAEKWVKLIEKMLEFNPHFEIHLIGLERDAELIHNIRNQINSNNLTYMYSYELKELINTLNSFKLIISPDTSIIHLASGLNKPVIGLYPKVDWNYERFKPLSDNFYTVISGSPEGIDDITHEEIFEKFVETWKRV
ncbi:MAG: glycosyltransferase family 9 protein [Bacteroidetes bacterium]|nr:glycosyltransferase family 9 protein [Bacteroidota bacterium]